MHRQCHCRLHQALRHACVRNCSGKDHRCRCTHRITSAQNDSGHQLALACRQDDVPDCIPSGTSQCIGRLHHLGRKFVKGLFCPNLNKGKNHHRQSHTGRQDTSSPCKISHQKTIGKQSQNNGGDSGNALNHHSDQSFYPAVFTVEHHIQSGCNCRNTAKYNGCCGKTNASHNCRPDSAFFPQHCSTGSLCQKFPADSICSPVKHISKQK